MVWHNLGTQQCACIGRSMYGSKLPHLLLVACLPSFSSSFFPLQLSAPISAHLVCLADHRIWDLRSLFSTGPYEYKRSFSRLPSWHSFNWDRICCLDHILAEMSRSQVMRRSIFLLQAAPYYPSLGCLMTQKGRYLIRIHPRIKILIRRRSIHHIPMILLLRNYCPMQNNRIACSVAFSLTDGDGNLQLGSCQRYPPWLFSLFLLSSRISSCVHRIPWSLLLQWWQFSLNLGRRLSWPQWQRAFFSPRACSHTRKAERGSQRSKLMTILSWFPCKNMTGPVEGRFVVHSYCSNILARMELLFNFFMQPLMDLRILVWLGTIDSFLSILLGTFA